MVPSPGKLFSKFKKFWVILLPGMLKERIKILIKSGFWFLREYLSNLVFGRI